MQSEPHPLTPRQHEILRVYAEEHLTKGVAHRLGISPQTVKTALAEAYRRLDVDSHLGAFAALGWLTLPDE